LTPVNSSNLAAVGYNGNLQELTIRFHNGGVYTYMGVPSHLHTGLMNAASKGSYHHQFIKDSYPYRNGY